MQWDAGDLHGAVDRLKDDRSAWQHQLDDSSIVERRAQSLVDAAHAVSEEARRHVREDTAEIERILQELDQRDGNG